MRLAGRKRTELFTSDFLTPYVRTILEDDRAEIVELASKLVKGDLVPPNRGIFHLTGTARSGQREAIPWAMYLKITRRNGREVSPTYFDPTQREALFYRLELSRSMNGPATVPVCLGVHDVEDDAPWVFLKEVTGSTHLAWPVERFGLVARHLGQFQGEFLSGRPLPTEEWVDRRHWLRLELTDTVERRKSLLEQVTTHPLSAAYYSGEFGDKVRMHLADYDTFKDAVLHLPATIIHGDLNPTNLISVSTPEGDRTIVIDWDYWGIGQMGIDTCTLIGTASIFNLPLVAPVREFVELMYDEYLAGLREAGWEGDSSVARFAVIGLPALVYGAGAPPAIDRVLSEQSRPNMESSWGKPAAEIVEHLVGCHEYLLELADEARGLMDKILPDA